MNWNQFCGEKLARDPNGCGQVVLASMDTDMLALSCGLGTARQRAHLRKRLPRCCGPWAGTLFSGSGIGCPSLLLGIAAASLCWIDFFPPCLFPCRASIFWAKKPDPSPTSHRYHIIYFPFEKRGLTAQCGGNPTRRKKKPLPKWFCSLTATLN